MPGAYDTFNRDMADFKRRGVPFGIAWKHASRHGLDRDQRQALTGTHDAWQRAYEGRPATPPDTAPSLLLAAIRTGTRIRHDPDEDTALTDGRRAVVIDLIGPPPEPEPAPKPERRLPAPRPAPEPPLPANKQRPAKPLLLRDRPGPPRTIPRMPPGTTGTWTCETCGHEKPVEKFRQAYGGDRYSECRACWKARTPSSSPPPSSPPPTDPAMLAALMPKRTAAA